VFASQPFRNQLITLTLTGAQIRAALEQQWTDEKRPRILQVSKGFSYVWNGTKPFGERVDAPSMKLGAMPIEPAKDYRVTINNYLALGGDGFTAFRVDGPKQTGVYDDEALFAYFQANSPIAPAPPIRITRTN